MDCTHTFHTGAATGIQRVVRSFADALLALAPGSGCEIVPARIEPQGIIPLPVVEGRVAFPRATTAREAVSAASGSRTVPRGGLLRAPGPRGPNANGLARIIGKLAGPARDALAITLRPTDVLLGLDSSWVYDIRSALDAAGRAGAARIVLFHDVLPMSQPQWFTEGTRRYFRQWIEAVLPRLEGVLTTTQATADDLRALCAAHRIGVRRLPPCETVRLGAQIPEIAGRAPRAELERALAAGTLPAFLSVGTLEPRKNVDFALDLFDALAARGLEFQWHIAGAPGWLADATVRRIHDHEQYGRRLHWWTDLDDAELAYCYRNATALVAVSRAEGFGLPLVEARLHGLPVFASDIPVFREVLDGEARFLPLGNAALAAAALEDFLLGRLPQPARDVPSRMARSWSDSAAELLAKIERLTSARRN